MKSIFNKFFDIYPFDVAFDKALECSKRRILRHLFGKNTWNYTFYINGSRYEFRNFRIYWAYRFLQAQEMDAKGFIPQTKADKVGTKGKPVYTNYANRYS